MGKIKWEDIINIFNVSQEENVLQRMFPRPAELETWYFSRYLRRQEPNFVPSPPLQDSPTRSPHRKKSRGREKSNKSVSPEKNKRGRWVKQKVKKLVSDMACLRSDVDVIKNKVLSGPTSQEKGKEKEVEKEKDFDVDEMNNDFFNFNMESRFQHLNDETFEAPVVEEVAQQSSPVVDVDTQTTPVGPLGDVGPRRTAHVPIPSAVFNSPYGQIDSTPVVKKKQQAKKKKGKHHKKTLLLDIYTNPDFEFMSILATVDDATYKINGLYTYHRLYNLEWNWEFWGALMGVVANDWLESWHIDLWSLLMMEQRQANARWRVLPTTSMPLDIPDNWATTLAGVADGRNAGVRGPPWWSVDQLSIPIIVPGTHWFLAEVNLKSWKVKIYDSSKGSFDSFKSTGRFTAFAKNMLGMMDETGYWGHFTKEQKRKDLMEFVEVEVPQQKSGLGDCGVFYACLWSCLHQQKKGRL